MLNCYINVKGQESSDNYYHFNKHLRVRREIMLYKPDIITRDTSHSDHYHLIVQTKCIIHITSCQEREVGGEGDGIFCH